MFNVAFIRIKDLAKIMFIVIFISSLVIFSKQHLNNKKNLDIGKNIYQKLYGVIKYSIEIPGIKQIDEIKKDENNIKNETKIYEKLLTSEFSAFNIKENIKNNETIEIAEQNDIVANEENLEENNEEEEKEEEMKLADTDVKTEIVTQNPIADSYTDKVDGVKIKNETKFSIDDENFENNLNIDKSNIIIFHTHTCESYTSSEKYTYTSTGKYRTTDLNYSVARVGDELTSLLEDYGINVIHDTTYHDYPSYNGSYSRSLSTVSNILKSTKADIIIDLHRDAIGSYSSYAPTVKIGEDYCAQLMFVMGSNGGGLYHPNWKQNLNFAFNIQKISNEMYPGLFKPIILRNSRYNQHLGNAACIIEVGSTGNTLEQCLNSMKYLAKIIDEY